MLEELTQYLSAREPELRRLLAALRQSVASVLKKAPILAPAAKAPAPADAALLQQMPPLSVTTDALPSPGPRSLASGATN